MSTATRLHRQIQSSIFFGRPHSKALNLLAVYVLQMGAETPNQWEQLLSISCDFEGLHVSDLNETKHPKFWPCCSNKLGT